MSVGLDDRYGRWCETRTIEGPPDTVDETFKKIKNDPRSFLLSTYFFGKDVSIYKLNYVKYYSKNGLESF